MEKSINLKELQKIELEILIAFRDFCAKHKLRYYLCGGTLIGAIRHKGFIPWDDDIDVMMPRPDFEKFLTINKNGRLDQYRRIDNIAYDDNALNAITRIYDERTKLRFSDLVYEKDFGCWIDIFPLDGVSEKKWKQVVQFKKARILKDLTIANDTRLGAERRSKIHTLLQYLLLPVIPFIRKFGHKRWISTMRKLSTKHDYDCSKYVGVIEGRGQVKEVMLKEAMEPAIEVEFCGEIFTAMANYDEYLTNLYGNYMIPPTEKGMESRHKFKIEWRGKK